MIIHHPLHLDVQADSPRLPGLSWFRQVSMFCKAHICTTCTLHGNIQVSWRCSSMHLSSPAMHLSRLSPGSVPHEHEMWYSLLLPFTYHCPALTWHRACQRFYCYCLPAYSTHVVHCMLSAHSCAVTQENGDAAALPLSHRIWLLYPFMHSENPQNQEVSYMSVSALLCGASSTARSVSMYDRTGSFA